MTAILVFSSPSLVPLLAAFMSCWTWSGEKAARKSKRLARRGRGGGGEVFPEPTGTPLEREMQEKWRSVGSSQMAPSVTLWVAARALIRECTSVSQRGYGNTLSSHASESQSCIARCGRIQLTTNSTLSITGGPTRLHRPRI